MIDVALTELYDICLFNCAAQVFFVRSGHGNPSDGLCALTSGWFERSQENGCFEYYHVFMKRQLKFYNGHLIRLLCVLCLSDYGNEAPRQFIKVHQTIGDAILGDGVRAERQICQSAQMQVEFEGFLSFLSVCWYGVDLILEILCAVKHSVCVTLIIYVPCIYSVFMQL